MREGEGLCTGAVIFVISENLSKSGQNILGFASAWSRPTRAFQLNFLSTPVHWSCFTLPISPS